MPGADPYFGREQTKTKHFILKRYLEALAYKVLSFSDIAYVDGFSGPWQTKTEDFRDSSFMIAIGVLQNAQKKYLEQHGKHVSIRCFFSEVDPEAFAQLRAAVAPFRKPEQRFDIALHHGKFEDAVPNIQTFVGNSFSLIFIDPTGWSGYPLNKIRLLFQRRNCEVLITFMYDFINRCAYRYDEEAIASLSPILGGMDWPKRLDPTLPRGLAVERLFRETLKSIGQFRFVVSTKIDRATADRPHFFITYGTKSPDGLKAFRQTEYDALRQQARSRASAKERKRADASSMTDLFAGHDAVVQEATIDDLVNEQKDLASADLVKLLSQEGPTRFVRVMEILLQAFMLRETNIKDICVELARTEKIEKTWGRGKPKDDDLIRLR